MHVQKLNICQPDRFHSRAVQHGVIADAADDARSDSVVEGNDRFFAARFSRTEVGQPTLADVSRDREERLAAFGKLFVERLH